VYKLRTDPRILKGSSWDQIGLETGFETLIFFCGNSTGTKHELVKVRSVVQLL